MNINKKSLIIAIIFGFLNWLWAFIIVGSAYYDFVADKPINNPNFGVYITLLIINVIISIIILAIYLWKYEQMNPIIPEKWAIDALVLGIIICLMNYLFDIIFFGLFMQRDLIAYFWLESTAGYAYPIIIVITIVLAYLIYGRNK